MSTPTELSIMLDQDACEVAYRAGQIVESCIIERATEVARNAGASTVTADIVRCCMTNDLLDIIREALDVRAAKQATTRARTSQAA